MKITSVNVLRLLALTLAVVFFMSGSAIANPQVSASQVYTVGLNSNGTCVATTNNPNVSAWNNVTQVSTSMGAFVVALKADGTCVASGLNDVGQGNVSAWTGITQIATSNSFTLGLKSDGTVVGTGYFSYGQDAALSWTGITQISIGNTHIIGLKADGTVVAAGANGNNQCNVSGWAGITQISAGGDHTVGLKSDGTVVAIGEFQQGQCNVGSWTGISQVSAGAYHTVGLKSDGTCVAVGLNVSPDYAGGCDVQSWTDIVQLSAGYYYTIGLKADGSVVGTGSNYWGQLNGIGTWNLGVTEVAVAVPNVVTLADTTAETTLTKASLMVGSYDSNYSTAPVNTVTSQLPTAGTKVRKGSAVQLTLSAGAAPESTATLKMLDQKTKAPIAGVAVIIKDKKGTSVQSAYTDIYGIAIINMSKAGQYSFYETKTGYTPVLNPDVQVLNKGAKNSIVSYMNANPVTAKDCKKDCKKDNCKKNCKHDCKKSCKHSHN
jgi:hypothetical protein